MKAGKALNERKVEIRVQYKPPAASIHGEVIDQMRNELVVRLLVSFHHQHSPAPCPQTVQVTASPERLGAAACLLSGVQAAGG